MLRTAALARTTVVPSLTRSIMTRAAAATPTLQSALFQRPAVQRPRIGNTTVRHSSGRPEKTEFETRALELLKGFEKIDPAKLSLTAHFSRDLGLDSLDTVEVLMAIEDEFLIEIPDQEADNMHTVQEAVNYVYERWTPQANW